MIAILCPTRGRPEQFKRMVDSVRKTSSAVKVFATADKEYDGVQIDEWLYSPDGLPTAQKWNNLAQFVMAEPRLKWRNDNEVRLFMLGSDDMYFDTPGWDKALIDHYNALENKVHVWSLQDSRDKDGTPHIICSREYIEAMNYFIPPIFLHFFVDTWTVQIAKANSCFTHMRDYLLVHDKPNDRGQADETHSRIRQWGWHERDKYVNDTMQHVLWFEKQRLADIINPPSFTSDSNRNAILAMRAIGEYSKGGRE